MAKTLGARRAGAGSKIKGAKVLWGVAIALALALSGMLFAFVSSQNATVTYYVLNQPVAARTLITAEMLHPVTTSEGGHPRNAFGMTEITSESVFSKFPLNAGDVVSSSNAGPLTPITVGIPDNFVVASFQAPAEHAVAGRVKRGDYIDIIAVDEDPETGTALAKYVLRSVLVLDVNSDLAAGVDVADDDPEATPSDSAEARYGVPTLYTVGVSREDALTLALVAETPVFVVLTSNEDVVNGVLPEEISRTQVSLFFELLIGDSGIGTDSTFGDGEPRGVEGAPSEEDPDATLPEPPQNDDSGDEAPSGEEDSTGDETSPDVGDDTPTTDGDVDM